MRRSFWRTYSTSLVCGWDRCCCRRPLQSQLWSRWGSFLQRGFEAPYWFYWSPTQKSRCSRPDGTQPGGESGQTCVGNIVAEGQSVWETCFSVLRFIFFLTRWMNLQSLHTHRGSFYKQDLPHFLHTLVFSAAFQRERKVTQRSHRLEEAKFLQRCDSVHFINWNRSFNFGRPDRGQPITTAEWRGLSFPRSEKLIYLGWQLLRASLFPQFWSFCYRSDKLTLYPVTSDSFSIALTCSQFRKIFQLVSFHSIFDGGRFGAGKKPPKNYANNVKMTLTEIE